MILSNIKKLTALILVTALSLTALSSCGKAPASDKNESDTTDEIVITIPDPYQSDNTDPEGITMNDVNTFTVDTKNTGKTVNSVFNNINNWNVNVPKKYDEYNIYDFTDYVQLMQCSGGTEERDLFKDPLDRTVLDDYDFTKLIDTCRGIIDNGAKPFLKLGSVPLKYTTNPENGDFNMNKYPPDDYNVYYNYIKALAEAMVGEFGRDEVLTWRFGVMTEYENKQWFVAKSGDPEDTKIEYFKLYDYTVQALVDAIGEDVFVGAHSMSCTEGLWDEADFIEHVAEGTNYATGKTGTRICYLAASYYHQVAGAGIGRTEKTFIQTIEYLQQTAKEYGLDDIIFGIDEGRMHSGQTAGRGNYELNARIVGYSYQGAFDARLFKQAVENDVSYFAAWSFIYCDIPTISYHIAKNTAEFDGLKLLDTVKQTTSSDEADIQAISAYDEDTKTLRIMAYNFKDSYTYSDKARLSFEIKAPVRSGTATITTKYVNDDCNFFDEWNEDRKTYNITDDMFRWSPDDPIIEVVLERADDEFANTYHTTLKPKYIEATKLTPETSTAKVKRNRLTIEDEIDGNSVVFYEIKF